MLCTFAQEKVSTTGNQCHFSCYAHTYGKSEPHTVHTHMGESNHSFKICKHTFGRMQALLFVVHIHIEDNGHNVMLIMRESKHHLACNERKFGTLLFTSNGHIYQKTSAIFDMLCTYLGKNCQRFRMLQKASPLWICGALFSICHAVEKVLIICCTNIILQMTFFFTSFFHYRSYYLFLQYLLLLSHA